MCFLYYRFVGSLIASDLLSSTILGPLLISDIKTISNSLTVFVATSTIFSILVIAMDRYTAVLSPLHYATNVTRQKSVLGLYNCVFVYLNTKIGNFIGSKGKTTVLEETLRLKNEYSQVSSPIDALLGPCS